MPFFLNLEVLNLEGKAHVRLKSDQLGCGI